MTTSPASDIVFISGNFNVLHAGHIRLFAFARKFKERLVVGVSSDRIAADDALINQDLRLEAVESNSWVSEVILIDQPISEVIEYLKPAIVVKGKEFEDQYNSEAELLAAYGGKLIFGSSELPLSSFNMAIKELAGAEFRNVELPKLYLQRHAISVQQMLGTILDFKGLKVCVIGDLIVDEYINCESLGMSQEDPSLVVTPIARKMFLGGAGIVAAHAAALGALCSLITVIGADEIGDFAVDSLKNYGVDAKYVVDENRPTTLKQRFRANEKTLLRVSHLNQNSINTNLQEELLKNFRQSIQNCDLIIFSDFNYGALPQRLITRCIKEASIGKIVCVADSQCSSQVGDVSKFVGMDLISATEREARISLRDNDDGLTMLAERLRSAANAKNVMVKLGRDGVLIHTETPTAKVLTSQIPALSRNPVDVAGAGDSMLTATGMALALGRSIWEAAAIGSLAAALQVARLGNVPINSDSITELLSGVNS